MRVEFGRFASANLGLGERDRPGRSCRLLAEIFFSNVFGGTPTTAGETPALSAKKAPPRLPLIPTIGTPDNLPFAASLIHDTLKHCYDLLLS
jgi:hypothetical protein